MTALIEGVAGGLAGWGPAIVARATVTLVLMLVVVAFSRKTRASVRHLVLTTGFGALLVLPVAQWMVPFVRVEIVALPVALEEYIARPPVMDGPVPEHANPLASSDTVLLPPDRRWRPTAAVMLTTLWIAAVVVFADRGGGRLAGPTTATERASLAPGRAAHRGPGP